MFMELEDMIREVEQRVKVAETVREKVLLESALEALKKAREVEKEKQELKASGDWKK